MISPAEAAWVRQQISAGVPAQQLRLFLQQKAHSASEIDDVLSRARLPLRELSIIEKMKMSMLRPSDFFMYLGQMEGSYGPVLGYWALMVLMNCTLLTLILFFTLDPLLAYLAPRFPQVAILSSMQWLVFFILLLFNVILLVIMVIPTLLFHLYLKIFGAKGTLLNTVQIGLYSSTPLIFLQFIPIVGPFLGMIWYYVLFFNGMKQLHKFSMLKTFVVLVIVPIILIAIGLGLLYGGLFMKTSSQFSPV